VKNASRGDRGVIFRVLADLVVIIHFAFVIFVVVGGWFVLKWRRVIFFHLPAAIWGALIEFVGWICPLTPLEIACEIRAARVAIRVIS
jgi:hypothetical protein